MLREIQHVPFTYQPRTMLFFIVTSQPVYEKSMFSLPLQLCLLIAVLADSLLTCVTLRTVVLLKSLQHACLPVKYMCLIYNSLTKTWLAWTSLCTRLT